MAASEETRTLPMFLSSSKLVALGILKLKIMKTDSRVPELLSQCVTVTPTKSFKKYVGNLFISILVLAIWRVFLTFMVNLRQIRF